MPEPHQQPAHWPIARVIQVKNPLSCLFQEGLPAIDVGVMQHGFAQHGRDYILTIQNSIGPSPGTYKIIFTHVVLLDYATRVVDTVWQDSWSDQFIDYGVWQDAGEPEGYVFGSNWSLAFPGFTAIEEDPDAASWSDRLGHKMHAATVETDRFRIRLIFHGAHLEKTSDDVSSVAKVLVPLPPTDHS